MDSCKLERARCNIDRINSEIVSLLIERMNNVDKVAEYKAAHGLPISVPEREKNILEKVSQLAGDEYSEDILPVFRAIFTASCHREERKIKVENL
jgi:monofunctional chorismate mutase